MAVILAFIVFLSVALFKSGWRVAFVLLIGLWLVALVSRPVIPGVTYLLPLLAIPVLVRTYREARRARGEAASLASSESGPSQAVTECQSLILSTLSKDIVGEDLEFDAEGMVAFQWDGRPVVVRVLGESMFVRVVAPFLMQIAGAPELLAEINCINGSELPIRLVWEEETLVVVTDVFADPLEPAHLIRACAFVVKAVGRLDHELQARFGGSLVSEVASSSAAAPTGPELTLQPTGE